MKKKIRKIITDRIDEISIWHHLDMFSGFLCRRPIRSVVRSSPSSLGYRKQLPLGSGHDPSTEIEAACAKPKPAKTSPCCASWCSIFFGQTKRSKTPSVAEESAHPQRRDLGNPAKNQGAKMRYTAALHILWKMSGWIVPCWGNPLSDGIISTIHHARQYSPGRCRDSFSFRFASIQTDDPHKRQHRFISAGFKG